MTNLQINRSVQEFWQKGLLLQMDRATCLSVEILQLRNISFEKDCNREMTLKHRKCRNLGDLGVRGQVITNIAIRYSTYDFLFDFNRNYASVLYRFRVIASYLSNVADCNLPRLHLATTLGMTSFEFRRDLWLWKVKSLGYRAALFALGVAVLIQCRRVTDTHIERHTTTTYTALA